jgi:hypothetical protein
MDKKLNNRFAAPLPAKISRGGHNVRKYLNGADKQQFRQPKGNKTLYHAIEPPPDRMRLGKPHQFASAGHHLLRSRATKINLT